MGLRDSCKIISVSQDGVSDIIRFECKIVGSMNILDGNSNKWLDSGELTMIKKTESINKYGSFAVFCDQEKISFACKLVIPEQQWPEVVRVSLLDLDLGCWVTLADAPGLTEIHGGACWDGDGQIEVSSFSFSAKSKRS